uniref:Mucin 4, cell surface associated n=1 Tax=Latimeria chalumnae TaxID=7897 RepID=H3B8Y7_LATCH
DVNECISTPCKRGSTCINSPGSYNCSCAAGWTGTNCTEDIDECSAENPCKNGKCINTPSSYKCICDKGWTGAKKGILIDIDECLSHPCMNGATCQNGVNAYRCKCVNGYTGLLCHIDINECASNPCKHQGVCVDFFGNYNCFCQPSWKGRNCDEDVDECSTGKHKCHKNANCTNTDGNYRCTCKEGYQGNGFDCKVSEKRLFDYGTDAGDEKASVSYKDYVSPLIDIPIGFPFDTRFYNKLYVSNLIFFFFFWCQCGWQKNLIKWLKSYIIAIMICAFRVQQYYKRFVYDFQTNPGLVPSFKNATETTINLNFRSSLDQIFKVQWAIKITWDKVPPYTGYKRSTYYDYTNTFQAVLATDGIYSFSLFYFQDGGMNWRYEALPTYCQPIMGYFRKMAPYFFAFPGGRSTKKSFSNNETSLFSTGQKGRWAYRLEQNNKNTLNPRQKCLNWYYKEPYPFWASYTPPCPCSFWQAIFDFSYTSGYRLYYYGFEIKNPSGKWCAMLLWMDWLFTLWRNSNIKVQLHCIYFLKIKSNFPIFFIFGDISASLYGSVFLEQEVDPYNACCKDSNFCYLYREKRPFDFCRGYRPPRFEWFRTKSIIMKNYTERRGGGNRKKDPSNYYQSFQGRTGRAGVNGTSQATNFISLVAHVNNGTKVQWNLYNENSTIVLVNETVFSITENSTYISKVTLEKTDKNEAKASFEGGISVTVSARKGALNFVATFDEKYKNKTEGLLGVFNDDPMDDFLSANGKRLEFHGDKKPNESQIFFEFGMSWKTTPNNSLFFYNSSTGESWYTYNNNSFVPKFYDELLATVNKTIIQKANETCRGNDECIFDILSTGDFSVGASTLDTLTTFQRHIATIDNFPPNITGPSTLQTRLNESVTALYVAKDPDDDKVVFSLVSDTSDITLTGRQNGTLTWYPKSSSPVYTIVRANDSKATSEIGITLVLCNCTVNATCNFNVSSTKMEMNGTKFEGKKMIFTWGQDYCEYDFDACQDNPCFLNNTCEDRKAPEEGFSCGACPDGLSGNGRECFDIDECVQGISSCEQICSNTLNGYNCSCRDGYQINQYRFSCQLLNFFPQGNRIFPIYPTIPRRKYITYKCEMKQFKVAHRRIKAICPSIKLSKSLKLSLQICSGIFSKWIRTLKAGYPLNQQFIIFSDINECLNDHTCVENAMCINNLGSYSCNCTKGYQGDGYLKCVDINECADNITTYCPNTSICFNTNGSYSCNCIAGYGGPHCADIDECKTDSSNCPENSTCQNNVGSYSCTCYSGFEGENCTDINECSRAIDNCHAASYCNNTMGSFHCECKPEYSGNGTYCEDKNECNSSSPCHTNATCTNTVGGYNCTCKSGFIEYKVVFEKYSNVPLLKESGCYATENKVYQLTKVLSGLWVFLSQNKISKLQTEEISLCSVGNGTVCVEQCNATCNENATCVIVASVSSCVCKTGFTAISQYQITSNHIKRHTFVTHATVSYIISLFSHFQFFSLFYVLCIKGFSDPGNGTTCSDINQCTSYPCSPSATCTNTEGNFTCTCKDGFTGNFIRNIYSV